MLNLNFLLLLHADDNNSGKGVGDGATDIGSSASNGGGGGGGLGLDVSSHPCIREILRLNKLMQASDPTMASLRPTLLEVTQAVKAAAAGEKEMNEEGKGEEEEEEEEETRDDVMSADDYRDSRPNGASRQNGEEEEEEHSDFGEEEAFSELEEDGEDKPAVTVPVQQKQQHQRPLLFSERVRARKSAAHAGKKRARAAEQEAADAEEAAMREELEAVMAEEGLDFNRGDEAYYDEIASSTQARKEAKRKAARAKPLPQDDGREDGADGSRSINWQIRKNKGLLPSRKKEYRNPRLRHRKNFEKATKRRKGAVREAVREAPAYQGETTGIRRTLTKSVSLS